MDYADLYIDFLVQHAKLKKPLKLVCDSSNGATGMILKRLLPKLNLAEYTLINDVPDPDFKAHGPNPLLPGSTDQLVAKVKEKKADLGVIFDADGDRAFFVDDKGQSLPSYMIATLLFKKYEPPYVVNELVYQSLKYMKLYKDEDLVPERVGFTFIQAKMREIKASVAAEISGHYCFKDFNYCDSGLLALVTILSTLSAMSETLASYVSTLPKHVLVNEDLTIAGKNWKDIEQNAIDMYAGRGAVIERRDGITAQLPEGWINIRPSNTEPLLRLTAGAKTDTDAKKLLSEVRTLV